MVMYPACIEERNVFRNLEKYYFINRISDSSEDNKISLKLPIVSEKCVMNFVRLLGGTSNVTKLDSPPPPRGDGGG